MVKERKVKTCKVCGRIRSLTDWIYPSKVVKVLIREARLQKEEVICPHCERRSEK
ncbi:hypothetical protein LCGC14_0896820 [marine sediment metagenome]|uniref:Uncharacterized protein n=1 Tax=marine sediment metagenome TaxID=412755 RepID=A0A0F9PIC3_9ZZZZ